MRASITRILTGSTIALRGRTVGLWLLLLVLCRGGIAKLKVVLWWTMLLLLLLSIRVLRIALRCGTILLLLIGRAITKLRITLRRNTILLLLRRRPIAKLRIALLSDTVLLLRRGSIAKLRVPLWHSIILLMIGRAIAELRVALRSTVLLLRGRPTAKLGIWTLLLWSTIWLLARGAGSELGIALRRSIRLLSRRSVTKLRIALLTIRTSRGFVILLTLIVLLAVIGSILWRCIAILRRTLWTSAVLAINRGAVSESRVHRGPVLLIAVLLRSRWAILRASVLLWYRLFVLLVRILRIVKSIIGRHSILKIVRTGCRLRLRLRAIGIRWICGRPICRWTSLVVRERRV
jgi:hypothetical protein